MENIQFVQCIQLAAEPCDFWKNASSIVQLLSVLMVVLASIYRSYTMTPIEKLYISGMDKVWVDLSNKMLKVVEIMLVLFVTNIVLPFALKLSRIIECFKIPPIILSSYSICIVIMLILIIILSLLGFKKSQTKPNKVAEVIYGIYMLFVFPLMGYDFIKEVEVSEIIDYFQKYWIYIIFIFLIEWLFFYFLGIQEFRINFGRKQDFVYMKLLNSKNGEELKVLFMENKMLICAGEGETEDNKYQFIPMKEVYDGNYVLTSNKGNIYVKKN